MEKIDFVVTWVDDTDPEWQKKKALHTGKKYVEGNTEARYRSWDTLKYWFRGVEEFAPWVGNIYFVTDNQKPEWLNIDNPKLKWVKHTDFIPEEYLPTFSSTAIEWNIHRIEGLSENFVLFNDDIFLINHTKPEDFFVDGLPCDYPKIGVLYANGFYSHRIFNNMDLINRNFSLKNTLKRDWKKWVKDQPLKDLIKLLIFGNKDLAPGCINYHLHISYNKSTFVELWEKEYEIIHETCLNKQRTKSDVNTWSARYWQLFSGNFYPKKPIGQFFNTAGISNNNEVIDYLLNKRGKVICLNDDELEDNFLEHKAKVINAFEKILPEKSSFEK